MTDRDIIQGLIDRDNRVTGYFFYVKCRPLLTSIMKLVFSYPVEYDELVSELYNYLMEDDSSRLRQFQFRSSVYQWLKVVATRFFIRRRDSLIDNTSKEPHYERDDSECSVDTSRAVANKIDVGNLLGLMGNRRYADVITHLVLNDEPPEEYALRNGITTDNLYNIKRRAMAALTRIAIKYYSYDK